ncbi:MAG TPA: hypothetical protein VFW83_08390, partial [Bryobacteraceae bacterium]|nr:hypothetical protein [Bryobacteraceae bacterium]
VFITTLDLKLARIYPLAVWKHNQQICSTAGENAAAAARLAFLAKVYGGDAEIDKAGRVLLPARLREALGLEKQPVWLDYYNEHIKVFTRQVYEERMQLSVATMGEDFRTLEKIGFK